MNVSQSSFKGFILLRMSDNLISFSRLTTIDESTSLLSDISYDQTDDSLVNQLNCWGITECFTRSAACGSVLLWLWPDCELSLQDWDSSVMRTVRLRKRQKRVSKIFADIWIKCIELYVFTNIPNKWDGHLGRPLKLFSHSLEIFRPICIYFLNMLN